MGTYKGTHNESGSGDTPRTPEYRSWAQMIQRCTNKNNPSYAAYGAKGITVCDRWRTSYEAFLEDMGRRPDVKDTIDRIDLSGNYCPENCRWASREAQVQNRKYCKVTKDDVLEIRKLFEEGTTQKALSEQYDNTLSVIHKIVRRKTWRNI